MDNTELTDHLQTKLHAVSKPEISLEIFKSKKDISELDIPDLARQVQKAVPEL